MEFTILDFLLFCDNDATAHEFEYVHDLEDQDEKFISMKEFYTKQGINANVYDFNLIARTKFCNIIIFIENKCYTVDIEFFVSIFNWDTSINYIECMGNYCKKNNPYFTKYCEDCNDNIEDMDISNKLLMYYNWGLSSYEPIHCERIFDGFEFIPSEVGCQYCKICNNWVDSNIKKYPKLNELLLEFLNNQIISYKITIIDEIIPDEDIAIKWKYFLSKKYWNDRKGIIVYTNNNSNKKTDNKINKWLNIVKVPRKDWLMHVTSFLSE